MKKMNSILLCLVFVLCSAPFAEGASAAMDGKQVCAKKDFMEFIAAFSELTVRQQAVCVSFPLNIKGRDHATQQAFLRSPAAKHKFIASKNEVGKSGKTATPFFLPLPADKNVSQFDLAYKYVYIIEEQGNKHFVMLTEGGTNIFETIEFLWNGEQWKIIEVRENP